MDRLKASHVNVQSPITVLAILMVLIQGFTLTAQEADSISLNQCTQMAIDFSSTNTQKGILSNSLQVDLKKSNTAYLPSLDFNAQATYQSDVTEIPIDLPGIEAISKDQYKAALDFQQLIYDGGITKKQKSVLETKYAIDQSQLDIDALKLKDRISGLYLNILLIDENLKLMALKRKDLNSQRTKLQAMFSNGIALKSGVDIMDAELLKVDQVIIELEISRQSSLEMLSSLIGKELSSDIIFETPLTLMPQSNDSERPEYKLFDVQEASLQNQSALINSKNMPKIFLFGTAGYGRPGLNMLNNDFDSYYLAGVKLTMPLTNWTSTRHEKQLTAQQELLITEKRKDFERNNSIQMNQHINEIEKYKKLIEIDHQIIQKREQIKEAEAIRLEKGVSTSNDYIVELNAVNQAMQNLNLHEIRLIQAHINYSLLQGK